MTDQKAKTPKLIGLVCGREGCFLYGDHERRVIAARPLYPPIVAVGLDLDVTFDELFDAISQTAPPGPNAAYLGMPAFRYRNTRAFDVGLQFCHIARAERERAKTLEQVSDLWHYFSQARTTG